jgi:serine/threonine protein phosphatase PrpC
MIIKLFDKNIDNDRFYLMISDTLDEFISKDDPEFIEELVMEFAQKIKEDIERIIDEVAYDWIADNTKN